MQVHVAFTPEEGTRASLAIVVDVLRATSTIARGAGEPSAGVKATSTRTWVG